MRLVSGPVYLRLCTDELRIVSEHWWDKFLLSQEKALAGKIPLDKGNGVRTSICERGTRTNGTLEQEAGREQRAVQV